MRCPVQWRAARAKTMARCPVLKQWRAARALRVRRFHGYDAARLPPGAAPHRAGTRPDTDGLGQGYGVSLHIHNLGGGEGAVQSRHLGEEMLAELS